MSFINVRFQKQYQGTDNIFLPGTVTANNVYFSIFEIEEFAKLDMLKYYIYIISSSYYPM